MFNFWFVIWEISPFTRFIFISVSFFISLNFNISHHLNEQKFNSAHYLRENFLSSHSVIVEIWFCPQNTILHRNDKIRKSRLLVPLYKDWWLMFHVDTARCNEIEGQWRVWSSIYLFSIFLRFLNFKFERFEKSSGNF